MVQKVIALEVDKGSNRDSFDDKDVSTHLSALLRISESPTVMCSYAEDKMKRIDGIRKKIGF